MNNYLIKLSGDCKILLRLLFFVLIIQSNLLSQAKNNLEIFYGLVDSATVGLIKDLGDIKKVNLELNFGTDYSVFANQVRGKLMRNGVQLIGDKNDEPGFVRVNLVIDNSFTVYSEPSKDNIFGDFYTERRLGLSGNYYISNQSRIIDFTFTSVDTINVNDVDKVENRSFPFTGGELPPEPFFSSILEPLVAVGAAAIGVLLFFSVRSK